MNLQFNNTTTLVIGASSGIGASTMKLINTEGGKVVAVSRNKQKLSEAIKRTPEPNNIIPWNGDTSKLTDVKKLKKYIEIKKIKLQNIVICSGASIPEIDGAYDLKIFNELIELNLTSVFLVLSQLVPLLTNGGSIVLVGSIRGRTGTDSHSAGYAAAKAGVINLTKTFALDFSRKNIRVNSVAPGPVYPTGMSQHWPATMRNKLVRRIPLGRLGKPEEIADVIVFLLSPMSSYITGQTIDVNGGLWFN